MNTTVIIGNGAAGTNAAATLRMNGYEGAIKLIGDEVSLPYQRPPLSKAWLQGPDRPQPTLIRPLSFYEDNRIDLMRARKVVKICLLYTSPSPRDRSLSRMPSSA